jgi:hypothetical protein
MHANRKILAVTALVSGAILALPPGASADEKGVVWQIGAGRLTDPAKLASRIQERRVTVDLRGPSPCPAVLGGRVREILLLYDLKKPGQYWLHVAWHGGGSGKEQFEVVSGGQALGNSQLVEAAAQPYERVEEKFRIELPAGDHELRLRHLSGDGLHLERIALAAAAELPLILNPALKFLTLKAYQREIKEPGVLLDGDRVRLYAPKRKATQARLIFRYLEKAYDELYRIVGTHTKYRMVVYHFPPGNPHARGGTSNCTLWYGYGNLNLDAQGEWRLHRIPHVSGYIEEMAHNFVSASLAQFGWEMVGWSISAKVSQKVAGNPRHTKRLKETRDLQAETFERYRRLGNTFPADIPANLCDRIHAYILWRCERKHGRDFWPDFFTEIRKERPRLLLAGAGRSGGQRRNARYQITVDCFHRLMQRKGVDFKALLAAPDAPGVGSKTQVGPAAVIRGACLRRAGRGRRACGARHEGSGRDWGSSCPPDAFAA